MAFDKRKALQNALAYTQQGKWDRAITEYQAILKADPHDLTVCNNLGDLYARGGKTAEAIEQYLKLGELYRADGLSVKAIAVYKKIAKLDPTRTVAYEACAELYWEQGLAGEAKIQMATVAEHYAKAGDTAKLIEAYQRLTQFDPTNVQVMTRLGDLFLKLGRREEAAAEYDQAAQAAGQTPEAKRLFQKARELVPESHEASIGQAELLVRDGKLAEAADVLDKVTAGEPDNAQAWRLFGEVRALQGQGADALQALEQAMGFGIAESELVRPLGMALLEVGRTDEALQLCQRITDEALTRGDPDAAIAYCRDLLAGAPKVAALHAHLATFLLNLGRDEEAQAALRGLAAAHEAAGEVQQAIATYQQLLERDPSDAELQARVEALTPGMPAATGEPEVTPAVEEGERPLLLEPPGVGTQPESADLMLSALEDLGLPGEGEQLAAVLPEEPAASPQGEESPFVLSAWEDLGLAAEPESPPSTEPAASGPETEASDLAAALQDLGISTDDQAASFLFEESAEAPPAPGEDLSPAEAAPDAGAEAPSLPDTSTDWVSEEIPALELEEAPLLELPTDAPEVASGTAAELAPATLEIPETGEDLSVGVLEAAPAPVEDFPPADLGTPELGEGEELLSSEVVEQLAEAEVYLKYGLEDKARERLLEVMRLAPENLAARRQLAAMYRGRRQAAEACDQILAIAKLLQKRGRAEAALQEVREGLALLPDHAGLRAFLASRAPAGGSVEVEVPQAAPTADVEESLIGLPEAPVVEEVPPAIEPLPELPAAPETIVPTLPSVLGDVVGPPPEVPLPIEEEEPVLLAGASPAETSSASAEDELPSELRALIEEAEETPMLVVEGVDADDEQAMADDMAEAEFYLSQGMLDEARTVHHRMQARGADHPAVARVAEAIDRAAATAQPTTSELPAATLQDLAQMTQPKTVPPPVKPKGPPAGKPIPAVEKPAPPAAKPIAPVVEPAPPVKPKAPPVEELIPPIEKPAGAAEPPPEAVVPKFTVTGPEAGAAGGDFVDLGAELEQEMAAEERYASPKSGESLVDGLLKEFQKGVREQLDEKDFETHYNLGIAYKEMELYDEAIQEFRLTARDPARALECADLLGLCFLAKGQPEQAIEDLRAGLGVAGHPPEAYFGLRYDLGVAHEAAGDLARALEQFEELSREGGARFRDVQARVIALHARLPRPQAPAKQKDEPPPPPRKKKISFI